MYMCGLLTHLRYLVDSLTWMLACSSQPYAICRFGALSLFKIPVYICYKNLYVHTAISLNTQLGYVAYKSLAYGFIYTLNQSLHYVKLRREVNVRHKLGLKNQLWPISEFWLSG